MNNYSRTRDLHMILLLSPINNFILNIKKTKFVAYAILHLISFFFYTIVVLGILSFYHCAYAIRDKYHHFSLQNKFNGTHTIYSFPVYSDKIIVLNPNNTLQIGTPSN
jgi:hypothetical protein